MFSPMLEAELEALLPVVSGPYTAGSAERWKSIRDAAAHIALGEYHFWYGGRRVENEPGDVQKRLTLYWSAAKAVHSGDDVWRYAWSAAFISYVLQQAGTDADFRYDSQHKNYVHWAISNAVGAIHPVQAHPITTAKPRVGDVVCKWRETPITYDSLRKIPNPPDKQPMHCDIVTEVEATKIWVVGGNRTPVSGVACPTVPKPDNNTGCTVNRGEHALLPTGFLVPDSTLVAVMRIGP